MTIALQSNESSKSIASAIVIVTVKCVLNLIRLQGRAPEYVSSCICRTFVGEQRVSSNERMKMRYLYRPRKPPVTDNSK